jgi:hypothetical protein
MFSQEVFDNLKFAGGKDLNDVVLINKGEVDKLHKKLLGHDGKVLDWIVFQVVIKPLLWVLFNGRDRIGCKQFLAFKINFLRSIKLLKVILHLIEQNQ